MNSISIEFFKAIGIVSMAACLLGILRLACVRTGQRSLRVVLGVFMAVMLLPSCYLYVQTAFPPIAHHVLSVLQFSIWLYGPVLLLLVHVLLHAPLRSWQWMLYLAPVMAVVTFTPLMQALSFGLPRWWDLLKFLQAAAFAVAALTWSIQRSAQLKVLVTAYANSTYYSAIYLCAGLLILLSLDFYLHFMVYIHDPVATPTLFYLMSPCATYSLVISLTLIWRIGSADHASDGEPDSSEMLQAFPHEDLPASPSRNLELEEHAAQQLIQQLDELIQVKRLHTRNDLSLSDLASELRISTHLASELLNCHLHTSFYDFLNKHRTQEAATLLCNDGNMSITDIAYEAGFNNTNTFYREFKRAYAVTPAAYRKQINAVPHLSAESTNPA